MKLPGSAKIVTAVASLLSALALPAGMTASAAPSNPWLKLGTVGENFNQPGLVVDPDGTLHVLWVQPGGSNTQNVVHTSVTLTGLLGTSTAVQTGWSTIEAVPDLVATSSGLEAFWGGIRSTDPTETNNETNAATAPASGSPWTLHQGNVAKGAGDYSSNIGAAIGAGGTPLESWAGTAGVYVHAGLDPATQNYDVQGQLGGCCGYYPDIAYDAGSGKAWVVWVSNATNHQGVYAQQIDPGTAAPVGSAIRLPGSATSYGGTPDQFDPQIQRTPVVASTNGTYVAYTAGYPDTNKIVLWRLTGSGVSAGTVIATGTDLRTPGIAADSAGRLWVSWSQNGVVHARRSNPTATRFGATVSVSHSPSNCDSLYELTPAAAAPVLDVVGTWGCSSQYGSFLAQLHPGLTVGGLPASFAGKTKVTFTVTDAGVPVAGAKVSAAGKSATTSSAGKATLVLGPVSKKTRISVTATKSQFTAGRTSVVAKPS